VLGQGQSTEQGGNQETGNTRLRPSSEWHPYYRSNAPYLLQMYDKAYSAYLAEQTKVSEKQKQIWNANARIAELAAEKQTIFAERSLYKQSSAKWEAMYLGLDMEYKSVVSMRNKLNAALNKANQDLLASQKKVVDLEKELNKSRSDNIRLQGEVEELKNNTPAIIKAALSERKPPTLYQQVRSATARVLNLGSYPAGTPATSAAAGGAWILATLFILGRIE
jgi:cell division protein FtsB